MNGGLRKVVAGALATMALAVWLWVFLGDHGRNQNLITGETAAEDGARRR